MVSRFQLFLPFLFLLTKYGVSPLKSTASWNMTPCSTLKVNRRFGETHRFHKASYGKENRWKVAYFILKTEAINSSETSDDLLLFQTLFSCIYRQQKVLSHFPVCCWIDWLLMIKYCLIESGPPCTSLTVASFRSDKVNEFFHFT
jgi:hypothetical protein